MIESVQKSCGVKIDSVNGTLVERKAFAILILQRTFSMYSWVSAP